MKLIKGMNLLKLDLQHFATSSAMSTNNQYIKYSITVTQNWQDEINAISNVTVTVKVWRTNSGYTSYDSGTCYCKIDGTTYSQAFTSSQKVTQNSNTVFFTKTLNIQHAPDGKKTLVCSAWLTSNYDVFESSEQSYEQKLTDIPRASVLGTISDFTIGNAITIPVTKYSSSFSDTLNIYVNNVHIKKIEGLTNGQSITFTSSELTNIYKAIPNSLDATFMFVNTTYSGANVLGTSQQDAVGTIPSSIKPSVSSITISEGNTDVVPSSWGVYVQNKSKVKFVINATGGTGTTIANISTGFDGVSYSGSSFTSNAIINSGNNYASIIVTDTRGRRTETEKLVSVQEYKEPYITSFSVIRCNSDGTANDKGTYAKVTLKGGISSVSGKNTPTYKINYKKSTDTEYQTHTFNVTTATINTSVILSNIDENNSYEFVAMVGDYFTSENPTKKSTPLSSAFTTVDYLSGGKGIAFGKVAEKEGVMDIAFDIQDKFGTEISNGLACYGSGDDVIDPDTTIDHLVLTNKNTPSGGFMYIQTFFYHEKSTTANRTQTAIPYNNDGSMYHRYYTNGAWSEWKRHVNKDQIHPVGAIYYTDTDTNPSTMFGGTWTKTRTYYGGELIAYGTAWTNSNTKVFASNANLAFSDIENVSCTITNYGDEILASSSGTIIVYPRGVVGMVEVTANLSGLGGNGLYGVWWRGNHNALPTGVTMLPATWNGITTGPIGYSYGGNSHSFFYQVEEGVTDYFFINPVCTPYGGTFQPSSGGVGCSLLVKAYAKQGKTYEWKRTA